MQYYKYNYCHECGRLEKYTILINSTTICEYCLEKALKLINDQKPILAGD
jgi:hypothetical protein